MMRGLLANSQIPQVWSFFPGKYALYSHRREYDRKLVLKVNGGCDSATGRDAEVTSLITNDVSCLLPSSTWLTIATRLPKSPKDFAID